MNTWKINKTTSIYIYICERKPYIKKYISTRKIKKYQRIGDISKKPPSGAKTMLPA